MKKFFFLLLLLASPLLVSQAMAAQAPDTFSNPAMEERARNLQRQLRCLICQGESIDESQSSFAADMRHLVHQQMAAGQSDQEIEQFLTARYGNFILMKPPFEMDTVFLWAAPFLVLILAGGVATFVISKARKAAADAPPEL